ncbi:MAG: hypothetical protein ACM37W_07140 [Actinomycetota bacterium]
MTNCPCCSHPMLRHIRQHQIHWFCRNCWQEMPLLTLEDSHLLFAPCQRTVIAKFNRALALV